MPVQVFPSKHGADLVQDQFVEDAHDVLISAWPDSRFHELLQSSFEDENLPAKMITSSNGFVQSIIRAYGRHHHLRIRPEDVWFAVLTQLSLYINKNSEELRDKFVRHEGKKELRIDYNAFSRHHFDYSIFSRDMSNLLQKHVTNPDLKEWMMPCFSTTTEQDHVVASIIMMGSLKKYFDFKMGIICGFPSVTLLGEREDYIKILAKLDQKIASFGDEARQFADLLKPIVRRFIATFDDPKAQDVLNFWQRAMYHDDGLCGVDTYSGWITAFCFWNEDGECLHSRRPTDDEHEYSEEGGFNSLFDFESMPLVSPGQRQMHLSLDGVKYHTIDYEAIPPGYTQVPVKIGDGGKEVETEMVAGSVGITCTSSGGEVETKDANGTLTKTVGLDTIQPETGWWIYAKTEGEPPAIAELREKALAKGVSEDLVETLVREARSTGSLPSDDTMEMFADMKS